MANRGSGYPWRPFPLTALVGKDIGISLMVATNKLFPSLGQDSVLLEI